MVDFDQKQFEEWARERQAALAREALEKKSWLKSNSKPLVIGFVAGFLLACAFSIVGVTIGM